MVSIQLPPTRTTCLGWQAPHLAAARVRAVGCEVASACAPERVDQLLEVARGVVRFGCNTQLGGIEASSGFIGVGAHDVVPDQGKQTEVDIADAGPFEVVESVALVER